MSPLYLRALPVYVDPIRLGKHLIERHDVHEWTVDHCDSDELRRMHGVLHRKRCEHVHVRTAHGG